MWVNIRWGLNDWENYSHYAFPWNGKQILPRLISISDISQPVLIDTLENHRVTIELSDHDGYFTEKLKTKSLQGERLGIRNLNCGIFTGWITNSPLPKENKLTLVADIFTFYDKPANRTIQRDEFQNCPGANQGKPGNFIFGHGDSLGDMFKAYRIADNTFLAAWNPIEIISVSDPAGSTVSFTYGVDANNYSYIYATSSEDFLYFSAKGPKDTSNNVIENPVAMINEYFTYYGDEFGYLVVNGLSESIDIYEGREYHNNCLHVTGEETIRDLFDSFYQSFGVKIIKNRANTLTFSTPVWGSEQAALRLPTDIIKDLKKYRDTSVVKKTYRRKYQFNVKDNAFKKEFADVVSDYQFAGVGEKIVEQKFIYNDLDSFDVTLRLAYLLREPLHVYTFSIPPSYAYQIEPGMVIEFLHKNSYYPTEYILLKVLRIRQKSELGFIEIEGFDISAIQQKTPVLYEAGNSKNPVLYEPGDIRNPILFFLN